MRPALHTLVAICALVCLSTSVSCSNYFPEGVKLPRVPSSTYLDTPGLKDFEMPTPGLTEHPARYLPVNHTRARFYTCPWAFAAPPGRLFGCLSGLARARVAASPRSGRAGEVRMSGEGGEVGRSRRGFVLLAGLAALGGGGGGAKAQTTIDVSKPTDEESVSFKEFFDGLNAGRVERVDFYGYSGDKAYATFKDGKKIRIGEGFPVEIGNEASSPLFVVKLLGDKGVPYKFHFLDGLRYKKMGEFGAN